MFASMHMEEPHQVGLDFKLGFARSGSKIEESGPSAAAQVAGRNDFTGAHHQRKYRVKKET